MNTLMRTRSLTALSYSTLNVLIYGKRLNPICENVAGAATQWNKLNSQHRQIHTTKLLSYDTVSKSRIPIPFRMEAEGDDKKETERSVRQERSTVLKTLQNRNMADYTGYELKHVAETILYDLESLPADKVYSPEEMQRFTQVADYIALNAIRIRDHAQSDEVENKEREKRSCDITIYNVGELDSTVIEERKRHDEESVRHFFRDFYGLDDIKLTVLRRYQSPQRKPRPLLVRLDSEDQTRQLFAAKKEKQAQGIRNEIWFTHGGSKLEMKLSKHLWLERNIRNKISRIKSEPWRWTIRGSRVVPVINKTKQNHDVSMQRLADELRALTARFRNIARNDEHNYQERQEKCNNVILLNVEESENLENRAKFDRNKVKSIFDELGLDYKHVFHIERVGWISRYSDMEPIRLVIPDTVTRMALLERSARIREGKEQWMKSVFVNLDTTGLKKYIEYHLRSEMKLRTAVAKMTNEKCYWMIKRERVVKAIPSTNK